MMICAPPVQPLLTPLQFCFMTKTVLLMCFMCGTVSFGTHFVQNASAQSAPAWPYSGYLTDLTLLLVSTLVSSSPRPLCTNRFLAWLALAAIVVVLPYWVNPV
jgi:hypothetical protein